MMGRIALIALQLRRRSQGLKYVIIPIIIFSLFLLQDIPLREVRQELNDAKIESYSTLTNEIAKNSTCKRTEIDYLESLLTNHTQKFRTNLRQELARMISKANRNSATGPILRVGAEVGVYKGQLSYEILKAVSNIETYYLVDPWRHLDSWNMPFNDNTDADFQKIYEEAMKNTVNNTKFGHKVKVIRDTTTVARHAIKDGTLDFVYIDGDHTAKGAMLDLIAWIPKVRCGGLVLGDDYADDLDFWGKGVGKYDPIYVKSAVDAFAAGLEVKLFDLGRKNWGFVKQKDYHL